ncbi:MAG: hypothetical protein QOK43_2140 [Acidimicrobiaceae bacterium]|nr:hypothetical protein [Acidimicrobiaceae bacterium]
MACTLDGADAVAERVEQWRSLLTLATDRQAIDGGLRIAFPPGPDTAADVARLAAAEQGCCSFFDFSLHITSAVVMLDVRAPKEAADLVSGLFGEAGPTR